MMNICFIGNFEKTLLFRALADKLAGLGDYRIHYIAVTEEQYQLLGDAAGDTARVLKIARSRSELPLPVDDPSVASIPVNDIAYNDRAMRYSIPAGVRELEALKQPVLRFLKDNNIHAVFGELTWAHELLIHRICGAIGCRYLMPHTVRIPNRRFGIFCDEYQSSLLRLDRVEQTDFELSRPEYFDLNNERLASSSSGGLIRIVKIFLFSKRFDTDELTYISRANLIADRLRRIVNKIYYRNVLAKKKDVSGRFAFYGMHMQPEASVDVIGRFYEDQAKLVINLWRSLPPGMKLLVKDHSNAIGDRGWLFYKRFKDLPNLEVMDDRFDSREIISKAEAVFTVSGTLAYEAALLGRPAFTFGPVFFNYSKLCRKIGLDDLKRLSIDKLIEETVEGVDRAAEVERLKLFVQANSFPGIMSDPINDPRCMNPENLSLVASGIHYALTNTR